MTSTAPEPHTTIEDTSAHGFISAQRYLRTRWPLLTVLVVLALCGALFNRTLLPAAGELAVLGDNDYVPVGPAFPSLQWVGWGIAVLAALVWSWVCFARMVRTHALEGWRDKPWAGLVVGAMTYFLTVVVCLASYHRLR